MSEEFENITGFSSIVTERIRWYVYALQDPRDQKIFYIGKGKGNRVFAHALNAEIDSSDLTNPKHEVIRSILQSGRKVNTFLIRHGIATEKEAYSIESSLIDLCHLLDPKVDNELFQLTNLVRGHDYLSFGVMSTSVVSSRYEAPPCPPIEEPILLFKIRELWRPEMTPEELFECTRGWWPVSVRREKAVYAAAVSESVIREVYKIESWRERVEGDRNWEDDLGKRPKWGFSGVPAPEMSNYLNKSVKHLYKRGEQGPKYLNC